MTKLINFGHPVTEHSDDSGCEPIPRQGGCTLAAYSEAKKLPEPFLTDLGLSDTLQSGKPVLQIPYQSAEGVLQAVRFRTGLEKGKNPRFRWRSGDQPCLYGLSQLRSETEVTLVEGESDTHTLLYHGNQRCWSARRQLLEGRAGRTSPSPIQYNLCRHRAGHRRQSSAQGSLRVSPQRPNPHRATGWG